MATTTALAQDMFVVENGAQAGPYPVAAVKEQLATGRMSPETLVWMDGMANWTPAGQVAELVSPPPGGTVTPPPPPPEQGGTGLKIYVFQNGNQTGPYDEAGLKDLVAQSALTGATMVWMEGMTAWKPARELTELAAILPDDAVIPPPPPETDFAQFMAGTWVLDPKETVAEGVGLVRVNASATYDARGLVNGDMRMDSDGGFGPVTVFIKFTGTFRVEPISETKFNIYFKGKRTISGPPGSNVPPKDEVVDESNVLTVLDDNTLQDKEGSISRRK